MLRKLVVSAVLIGVATAVAAPVAAADSGLVYAGVYPSQYAALAACNQGIYQGRWTSCYYYAPLNIAPQVELWVSTNNCAGGCLNADRSTGDHPAQR